MLTAMATRLALSASIAALRVAAGAAFVEVGSACVDVPTVRTYDAARDAGGSASAGGEAVDAPAAVVELPYCAYEVVEVKDSGERARASLDLSSKQIQVVESVPAVAILDASNNSISTLRGFDAPPDLRVLDLHGNAFESLQNASIPATVQVLNLSANSFTSIAELELPAALTELTVSNGDLVTLENVTFPSTVTSLNFSTNPITRVAGVVFPESLEHLTLRSVQDADNVLREVEVRATDAARFMTLQTWDVSSTIVFTCSDSRAKLRYVQNTLLCVLDDNVFAAKYLSGKANSSGSAGAGGAATIKQKLHATMQQPRTWFLIVGSGLLCAIAAVMLSLAILSRRNERRQDAERSEWRRQADDPSYKQLLQEPGTPPQDSTPREVPAFV